MSKTPYQISTADVGGSGVSPLPEPKAPDIQVLITEERMQRLKSGIWRRANAGDYDAQMRVISHFMVGERGVYVGHDKALGILDEMDMGEVGEAMTALNDKIQSVIAPKA